MNVDDDITPSPLNLALDKEDEDICLILLRHGAYYYKTLFFKACQYGCEKVVRHMLQLGTNINSLSQHQETALMFSLNPGSSNRLRRKLAYTTDKDTSTSEAYVVLQRTVKLIHLLSENGCNLEIKDSLCNLTVLQRSMQSHNLPAVIALLKHGAYFTLDDACLHIEYITDQVFNDLSDLYKMFTFYSIPNYIQRKWKWRRSLEQPSTLQHICRITIRERLKSCRRNLTTLLPRIEKLELPRQLKDFLSYKEIDEMDAIYCDKFFDIRWCIS